MTPPWPVPRCTPHGNRHACDVASSAVVRTGRVSPYSERCCDRNRCLAASQPISVAGREIEESASRFLSDRNRPDFSSPPRACGGLFVTPHPPNQESPLRFLGILPSRGASPRRHSRARRTRTGKSCACDVLDSAARLSSSTACSQPRTSVCSSAATATKSSRC